MKGKVDVSAIGLDGPTEPAIAHADSQSVQVTPGQVTTMTVSLVLKPGAPPPPPDGGTGGAGGADGGGGAGGSGGGVGGSGGTDASVDTNTPDGSADVPRPDVGTDVPVVSRAWTPAGLAEMNVDEADTQPYLAVDPEGNGTLVWLHGGLLWTNRYNAQAKTWGTAGPLGATINADAPQVAVDSKGIATVVWARASCLAEERGIWSSTTMAPGGAWTTPVRVSAGHGAIPSLAVGGNGTAIAAWTENNYINSNNEYVVWISSRPLGGSWAPTRAIQNARDVGNRNPRVAMDGAGNGFLIWQQTPPQVVVGDDNDSVYVSRYTAGNFGVPMLLESLTGNDADAANVSINAGGVAVATWLQTLPDRFELWSRIFATGSWGAPMMVTMGSGIDWDPVPESAVDPAGNATLVWAQTVASGNYNARIARYRAGQPKWDDPIALETDNQVTGNAADSALFPWPDVAVDALGNAHALWRKKTASGLVTLWTRRLDAAGTLGPALRLDTENMHNVFNPQIEAAANGIVIASWYHAIELNIWAAVFR
ncbi:MAG TPA: hypothetical protein VFH73_27200 [Polyangia bacterium]|nr:hypothetical protein [Polyangia bacterium]